MIKENADKLINAAEEKAAKAHDMDIIANAFKSLPKGQYKKVVTQDVLDALERQGVNVS